MTEANTVEAIVAATAELFASHSPPERKWGSWVIEANIAKDPRQGRDGATLHTGTPKFRGGAKVYVAGLYWGMVSTAVVVGRHRMDHQYLGCAIALELLEKLRPKVLYSPGVARIIAHELATSGVAADCFYLDEEEAVRAAELIGRLIQRARTQRSAPREDS
jgi:hypothetical protein